MKNIFAFAAAIFALAIIIAAPAFCADKTARNPNRELIAGIFNFEGYHGLDENNNLEGYGIDLLGLLSEYSHLNFKFAGYENSWKDMQQMLKDGVIDIVGTARRTPEREEIFAFSLPVGRNHTMLTKQLYNNYLRAGDYSTYDGMRIGAVKGSTQNSFIKPFAQSKGFNYTLIEFESPNEMEEALQKGEVDALLSSNLRKPTDETLLDIVHSDNFYMIARKEDQDIIDEINQAIEQMNLNEGDWQNDLYYKHYGPKISNQPHFSAREKQYMDRFASGAKKVTAIARSDIPPYSYMRGGKLQGILPDYFRRTMKIAGLPYTFVIPKDSEDYDKKANSGDVDIVIDRLIPDYANMRDGYSGFATDPYMITGLARVMRKDFNGPVRTLALADRTPLEMHPELLKDVEIRHYPSPKDAMEAVQSGNADAAYVLPYTAQMHVNRNADNDLYYSMMNDPGASFRMYVPADGDHELMTILKKSIKGLPSGTLSQLGSNYISYNAGEMSVLHYLHANPEIMLGGVLAVVLTSGLLLFMWVRGRWSRRLLETTEYANHQLEGQLAIVEALSRDYSNVLAINPERETTSIIKIFGYVPSGKRDAPREEKPYDQILETYIKQKVHPDDRERVSEALALPQILERLAANDEYSGTYRIVENGESQYYQFTFVRPHEEDGRNSGLILAGFRNIDDVIRREQKQKKKLADALAQARYASAAKTAFLNNMSHDIRTPMNAIIGFTSLAAANVRNAPMVQRYLGKIMTSGNHLLSLINDVLDMSRIESGKVKIEEKENSLPEILHDLRTIVQADVKSKQLAFQIDTFNVYNEIIYCDRLRLNQILLNILSNAMKYTNPGGRVSVRVIQTKSAIDGKASYEFRVKDTGIGMSPAFLEHVFEPFEREQTTTVSGIQGTGLGLAITKKIVDMMGGTISVESTPGKGSEFIVSFMFRVSDVQENLEVLPQFANVRTLIVDDDINSCTSLSKMLSSLGLRPDWTTLGKEALVRTEFANDQKEPYEAFFIDWIMGDMNGIELVRRLRRHIPDDIPIIIMTAYDWTDIEEEGYEAGVTAFISKPVFLSDLRSILAAPVQPAIEEKKEEHPEIFQGRRILLAEDNEMNQEIAQMILEDAGFELEIVENGKLAVDKIDEMPANTYDLILMDVQMPVMNGYDATRAIRAMADKSKAGIPIIAMTANAFDEDREEAINAGMSGYVAKPIDLDQLMETLRQTLTKKLAAEA